MTKYTARERFEIIKEVTKKGRPVAQVCRQYHISRTLFYRWLSRYRQAEPGEKRRALAVKGRNLLFLKNKVSPKAELKILKIVIEHPEYSTHKIAGLLANVGNHGVQNVLKRLNLNTVDQREAFTRKRSAFPPLLKRVIVGRVIKGDEKIAKVCREYGISRTIFYRWLNRYQESGGRIGALRERVPKIKRYSRQATDRQVEKVLKIVIEHPEYSTHKIAGLITNLGNHGVQNVFQRLNLNTYEKRVAFAESFAPKPVFRPTAAFWDRIKLVWAKFVPSLAPAPPPAWDKRKGLLRSAAFGALFTLGFGFISYRWLMMLSQFPPGTRIGLFFATIALTVGSFFFLYSLKYYITIALILSFSRESPGEESFSGRRKERNGQNLLAKIFNFNGGNGLLNGNHRNGNGGGRNGLSNNVQDVKLKRYPFVSIHLPFYNEKKVAKRILDACTSIDYPNFEIIVCDDSDDETVQIVQTYAKKHNSKLRRQGKKGPFIEVLHRLTREGFKGAALGYALKRMDPRTEFVVVFDADFVPYPDTLTQFLKYFKASNPVPDGTGRRPVPDGTGRRHYSEDYTKSNVAVVGGYQWHVLNKSENWITRGVRTEYAGSYVIERPGRELTGALKQISGSVYMARADVLKEIGWGTSITEDFQMTLRLYEKGYKVVYTPYVQAPAECVSTLKRLIRQRMRWAEGHSFNIKKMFLKLMTSPKLTLMEKLEVLYISPYYLQAAFFLVGTLCWLLAETVFRARLPFWTA
ncbi:glycosyltransferase, partial [Patescibacteria group bacterium]|nr:glycosyltransferase [Patescibacteria group bacterium]